MEEDSTGNASVLQDGMWENTRTSSTNKETIKSKPQPGEPRKRLPNTTPGSIDENDDTSNSMNNTKQDLCTCRQTLQSNIFKGGIIRAVLVFGNFMAAWRTVVDTGDALQYCWLGVCAVAMVVEFELVVYCRKGIEWQWWSPCFVIYLGTTLPLVWQLQLQQHHSFVKELDAQRDDTTSNVDGTSKMTAAASATSVSTTTESATTTVSGLSIDTLLSLGTDVWVIIINESLLYFIIIARWFLPRGQMKRDALSDMLLEYLGMASDIMELLAIFDEGPVRADLFVNYWILSVWSASFIQFIPIFKQKRKHQRSSTRSNSNEEERERSQCIDGCCGESFAEVMSTWMSILLQDGPFLVLRLYIMVRLDLITYSLVFFVCKNLFTLVILFYRFYILLYNIPCSKRRRHRKIQYANERNLSSRAQITVNVP